MFFKYSAKRKHILLEHLRNDKSSANLLADSVVAVELIPTKHYRRLPMLSDTRWQREWIPSTAFLHIMEHCAVRTGSAGSSASDAEAFLKRLSSFKFLTSALTCHNAPAFTRPLTVALQAKDCDLYKAHQMAPRLVKVLEGARESATSSMFYGKE